MLHHHPSMMNLGKKKKYLPPSCCTLLPIMGSHCLKITQIIAFEFFLFFAFSTNFCPIKTDMSGNTVWPQASGFQKLAKMDHFGHFPLTFVHSKWKRSSLRSQCWMRLFLWFSNTLGMAYITEKRTVFFPHPFLTYPCCSCQLWTRKKSHSKWHCDRSRGTSTTSSAPHQLQSQQMHVAYTKTSQWLSPAYLTSPKFNRF